MYSRVLDQETLAAVIAAAPKTEERPLALAKRAVMAMAEFSQPKNANEVAMWELSVSSLAEAMKADTPHTAGRVLHDLGLNKVRRADGFYVMWNSAQLRILRTALGV